MNDPIFRARARRITFLFMLTYFVSYVMRVNYSAVVAEMVSATGQTKSLLSLALTFSAISYGAGQIVSGVFGDRFQPKYLVAAGISASALMNFLIPFCPNAYVMAVVWCVNGFAQAFFWPPIVRLMTENFGASAYKKYSVYVTYGSSLGSVAVYLVCPLLILWSGYKLAFFVSGICGALLLPVWLKTCPKVGASGEKAGASGEDKAKEPVQKYSAKKLILLFLAPSMIALVVAIALQGMLKDGVIVWTPSLVKENFGISSSSAILSGVVLPVFGIVSVYLSGVVYRKLLKNPMLCAAVFFGVGASAAVALVFLHDIHAALTVTLCALLIASMQGVNLILTCMIPPYFGHTGRVSTVSGVLNSFAYVGIAISTFMIAFVSEQSGWTSALIVLAAAALAGTALCALCVRKWKNG